MAEYGSLASLVGGQYYSHYAATKHVIAEVKNLLTQRVESITSIVVLYLVNTTNPFIVMDMYVKCNVDLVFLPELLQVFPSHGFFKCSFLSIPIIRRVAKDTMSSKEEPRLFLSVY